MATAKTLDNATALGVKGVPFSAAQQMKKKSTSRSPRYKLHAPICLALLCATPICAHASPITVTTTLKKSDAAVIRIVDPKGRPVPDGVPAPAGQIFDVTVGPGFAFSPDELNISIGDTVRWTWASGGHSVTSGAPCIADGQFCSPDDVDCDAGTLSNTGTVYVHTFAQAGTYEYFCFAHCGLGMTGVIHVAAGPTPTPIPTPSCPPPTRCYEVVVVSENFDNVTPPDLPPDWLATNAQGPPPLWVTSNSGLPVPPADTLPNAAFIDDPDTVSDKRVDSLQFFFGVLEPQLTFRHNFNLEASDVDPNLGFDGGVLELSTDGGNTFQDILDAGGSFVAGGYNRTISTDRGSPIAGRQAWSGNSKGFITTVVNLPFFGNLFRLRWRMASDTSGSSEGWRVDTLYGAGCAPLPCSTPSPTPPITPTPTPTITPTPTPTPTSTATPTPTSTATPRPTPTPRLRPVPRPRPTPP
jgi:plastocyanin